MEGGGGVVEERGDRGEGKQAEHAEQAIKIPHGRTVRARVGESKAIGAVEQGDVLAFPLKPTSFLTERAFPLTAVRRSQLALRQRRHLHQKLERCSRQQLKV